MDSLNNLSENLNNVRKLRKNLEQELLRLTECLEQNRWIGEDRFRRVCDNLQKLEQKTAEIRSCYEEFSGDDFAFETLDDFEAFLLSKREVRINQSSLKMAYRFLNFRTDDEKLQDELEHAQGLLRMILKRDSEKSYFEELIKPFVDFTNSYLDIENQDPVALISNFLEYGKMLGNHLVANALMKRSLYLDEKEPAFVEQAMSDGCVLSAEEIVGSLEVKLGEGDGDAFHVRDLKREAGGRFFRVYKQIFRELAIFGYVNEGLIYSVMNAPRLEEVMHCFENLLRMGYLRQYQIEDSVHFFGLSPKGREVLQSKEACSFLGIRVHRDPEPVLSNQKASCAIARYSLLTLAAATGSSGKYSQARLKLKLLQESFFVDIWNAVGDEKEDRLLAIGTFWTQTGEIEAFLNAWKNFVQDNSRLEILLILAYSKAQARSMYELLGEVADAEQLEAIKEARIYFYSYEDGEYYGLDGKVKPFPLGEDLDDLLEDFDADEYEDAIISEVDIAADADGINQEENIASETISQHITNPDFGHEIMLDDGIDTEDDWEEGSDGDFIQSKSAHGTHAAYENYEAGEKAQLFQAMVGNYAAEQKHFSQTDSGSNLFEMDDLDLEETVYRMLVEGRFDCACALLHAYETTQDTEIDLTKQLAYAVGDPAMDCKYDLDHLFAIFFQDSNEKDEYLTLSAGLRTFFDEKKEFDYGVRLLLTSLEALPILNVCPALDDFTYRSVIWKEQRNKDEGYLQKTENQRKLLEDLGQSRSFLENKRDTSDDLYEQGGITVLLETLSLLEELITGVHSQDGQAYRDRKYFYIDFLRSDFVLLDENYLPEKDTIFEQSDELSLTQRILQHGQIPKSELPDAQDRLDEIKAQGQDFGSARMLMQYLYDCGCMEEHPAIADDLEELTQDALESAQMVRDEFFDRLELEQSYGWFAENALVAEDGEMNLGDKERMLWIVDQTFEQAQKSSNFSFFYKVVDSLDEQLSLVEQMHGGVSKNRAQGGYFKMDPLADFIRCYEKYYGKNKIFSMRSENGKFGSDKVKSLLESLKLAPDRITSQPGFMNWEIFGVNLKKPLVTDESLQVVCIPSVSDIEILPKQIKEMGGSKYCLLFLDQAITLKDRRHLARQVKTMGTDRILAILDRVMLGYLAENCTKENIDVIFRCIALPFADFMPYSIRRNGAMSEDIFVGREDELQEIISPTGPVIMYGGRQLGKTALLRMAKSRLDREGGDKKAILVNLAGLDYKKSAEKLSRVLYGENILEDNLKTEDWNILLEALRDRLTGVAKKEKIPYLLLLFDDADIFVSSCSEVENQPLDALLEMQNMLEGRFKFVISGSNEIVRFCRSMLLEEDGEISELNHIALQPLDPFLARKLLEIPLYYLGLRFPEGERDELIAHMFAQSAYYPGLIQMFAVKLLERLRKEDYAGYDETVCPPFEVTKKHMLDAMEDSEYKLAIAEMQKTRLQLNGEENYLLILRLMANLLHENGFCKSYSAADLYERACKIGVHSAQLSERTIGEYLEEMCELNLIQYSGEKEYQFHSYRFYKQLDIAEEIEENRNSKF